MAIHAVIDTNVFLAFYAYTKDDVEQLRIVSELVKSGKLVLYLPEQVVREFHRNREIKLAESIKTFRSSISAPGLPRYMMDYAEVQQFRDGYKALETARAKLAEAVMNAAGERKLGADTLFEAIAAVATMIATTPDILLAAQRRKIIGDPPGKGESHGDQIIWEVSWLRFRPELLSMLSRKMVITLPTSTAPSLNRRCRMNGCEQRMQTCICTKSFGRF